MPRTRQPHPLDESAVFSQLYEDFHVAVFRYIYGLHEGSRETVEDLTAETFTKAWRSRRTFQGDGQAAKSWILQIAHNLVIDAHRRRAARGTQIDIDEIVLPDFKHSPEERTENQQQLISLFQAMRALSFEERELLVLRYVLDWRIKDIGLHLNIPENTVSVTIKRLLERLRKNWPASEKIRDAD